MGILSADTVGDLSRYKHEDQERFRTVSLGAVEFDSQTMTIKDGEGGPLTTLLLEDDQLDVVANYFKFPKGALQKLPTSIRGDALEWFRTENEEQRATLEIERQQLAGIWNAEKPMIPRGRIIDVLQGVVPADAQIKRLDITEGKFAIDVTAGEVYSVEPRVGDITLGGLRVFSHIQPARGQKQQPRVASFWHRLACTNGMTRTEDAGHVVLRGSSVEEVIEEMEIAARKVWDVVVPQRLEQFAHLANGEDYDKDEAATLVHRLCRENGISEKVESAAIEKLAGMESRTMYDLLNLINGFQNEDGVRGTQFDRLQELAGTLVSTHADRCPNCLTTLD